MVKIYQQLSLNNVSVQGAPWKKGGKTVRARGHGGGKGKTASSGHHWAPAPINSQQLPLPA